MQTTTTQKLRHDLEFIHQKMDNVESHIEQLKGQIRECQEVLRKNLEHLPQLNIPETLPKRKNLVYIVTPSSCLTAALHTLSQLQVLKDYFSELRSHRGSHSTHARSSQFSASKHRWTLTSFIQEYFTDIENGFVYDGTPIYECIRRYNDMVKKLNLYDPGSLLEGILEILHMEEVERIPLKDREGINIMNVKTRISEMFRVEYHHSIYCRCPDNRRSTKFYTFSLQLQVPEIRMEERRILIVRTLKGRVWVHNVYINIPVNSTILDLKKHMKHILRCENIMVCNRSAEILSDSLPISDVKCEIHVHEYSEGEKIWIRLRLGDVVTFPFLVGIPPSHKGGEARDERHRDNKVYDIALSFLQNFLTEEYREKQSGVPLKMTTYPFEIFTWGNGYEQNSKRIHEDETIDALQETYDDSMPRVDISFTDMNVVGKMYLDPRNMEPKNIPTSDLRDRRNMTYYLDDLLRIIQMPNESNTQCHKCRSNFVSQLNIRWPRHVLILHLKRGKSPANVEFKDTMPLYTNQMQEFSHDPEIVETEAHNDSSEKVTQENSEKLSPRSQRMSDLVYFKLRSSSVYASNQAILRVRLQEEDDEDTALKDDVIQEGSHEHPALQKIGESARERRQANTRPSYRWIGFNDVTHRFFNGVPNEVYNSISCCVYEADSESTNGELGG